MTEYDLVLKEGRIIDVLYGEISQPTDVAISDRRIVGIGSHYKAKKKISVKDKFLTSGFGDLHYHNESTMLTPTEAIKIFLLHGTTYGLQDPHEVANVAGIKGIEYMMDETKSLPFHGYFAVPSCVPATDPKLGLETSGSYIDIGEVERLMKHPRVLALGEVVNIPGVLNREETIMRKTEIALEHGKIVEGHAPRLTGYVLKKYVKNSKAGSDHEITSYDEAKEKLECGLYVYIREGSACHDLEPIIKPIVKKGENTDKLAFCTDDINAYDLIHRGHIDHCIKEAIKLGMEPVEAFRIGSYNGYRRLDKEKRGAIEMYYDADLVVISTPDQSEKTLDRFRIDKTIYNGKIVVNNGELLVDFPEKNMNQLASNSVKLAKKYEPEDFTINLGPKSAEKEVQARVIGVKDGTIETKELFERMYTDEDGILHSDPEKDITPTFVIGRHETSKGNVGRGFVKGIGIKKKIPYAVSSSVAHDCHNIVAIGTKPRDISIAVNRQKDIRGGIVLVENGYVMREIPLSLYGLMSTKKPEELCEEQERMDQRIHYLGSKLEDPLATLSFIALPVIPELKLTDKGLVKNFKIVPLVVE